MKTCSFEQYVETEETNLKLQRRRTFEPKCTISIKGNVLSFIEKQAQRATDKETGGIIGGFGSAEEGTIVISHVSDGGPAANCSPKFFSRDTQYCQRIVDKWASESSGKIDYLGEWHKHFEKDPRPSFRDLQTLKEIARSPDYHVATALLLIIGSSNTRSSLRVFLIDHNGQCVSMDWQFWNKNLNT